jgi:hypothetical protein
MRSLKHRLARLGLGLGLAATMALSAIVPALADEGSLTITGGSLNLAGKSVDAATGVALNGLDKTTSYTINLDVNDPTGTGAGWNVTMTSTTFKGPEVTGVDDPENAGKNLPGDGSWITTRPTTVCHSGSTCTVATDVAVVNYAPYVVPADDDAPTATKMYSAAVDSGLGRMDLAATVTIDVPANTYAGAYTSTITLALISAP